MSWRDEENVRRRANLRKDAGEEEVLRLMNASLEAPHAELLGRLDDEVGPPLILVAGLPRAGTTLAMQLLVNGLDLGYMDNLAARFWAAPLFGIHLSRILAGERRVGLGSHYGKTEGWAGPHEFAYFWHRWFGLRDSVVIDDPESREREIDWRGLGRVLRSMARVWDRALLLKGLWPAFFASRFSRELPRSLFVMIRREPLDVAVSLYRARLRYYGSPDVWWSLYPPAGGALEREPWDDQIAAQVTLLSRFFEHNAGQLDPDRVVWWRYRDLCASPGRFVDAVSESVRESFGYEIPRREPAPDPQEIRSCDRESDEARRLAKALARWADRPERG